jgi:DNA (cytosine-5)-methyltransferase 1
MTIGSLFSGIGGLELGLEAAGLGPVLFQAEIDPFASSILAKHWPDAQRFSDVRTVGKHNLPRVDVLCGGFPCQGLSSANLTGEGLEDERSGLWFEFERIIGELLPRAVVVENVGSAWREWVPVVRRALWTLGYASVPFRVSPADFGAPHHRDRIFVVAHADAKGQPLRPIDEEVARLSADAERLGCHWRNPFTGPVVLAHGLPGGMDAVRAFGNAVVPQCAEAVGWRVRQLMTLHDTTNTGSTICD